MLKLLVVGDSGYGKTTAIGRFMHGEKSFDPCVPTVGVDMHVHKSRDSPPVYIWDVGGGHSLLHCTIQHLRGSHGVVVVYDASKTDSQQLSSVARYVDVIKGVGFKLHSLPIVVIGNKCDILPVRPAFPSYALYQYLQKRGIRHEYSCNETWESCRDAFNCVICHVRKFNISPLSPTRKPSAEIAIRDTNEAATSYCAGCIA